jgi:hypothetical protein
LVTCTTCRPNVRVFTGIQPCSCCHSAPQQSPRIATVYSASRACMEGHLARSQRGVLISKSNVPEGLGKSHYGQFAGCRAHAAQRHWSSSVTGQAVTARCTGRNSQNPGQVPHSVRMEHPGRSRLTIQGSTPACTRAPPSLMQPRCAPCPTRARTPQGSGCIPSTTGKFGCKFGFPDGTSTPHHPRW